MYEKIMKKGETFGEALERLIELIKALRSPEGCPWDREQTHKSLVRPMIEEAYEATWAMETGDFENLKEELGDVLLQVVMNARIAEEEGKFSFTDVANGVCDKMISRHPHVFGKREAGITSSDVLSRWEDYKAKEPSHVGESTAGAMKRIPRSLPALLRADKVQSKAAKEGFDWDDAFPVFDKIEEEALEIKEAIAEGDPKHIEAEVGDILFAAENLSRLLGVDPERALNGCSDRFIERFSLMEEKAEKSGKKLKEMSLPEMDALWEESKKEIAERALKKGL